MGDEAYKMFFNTAGTHGEISDALREILRYMNNPKGYPVKEAGLSLIRSIDKAVRKAKMSTKWRHAVMMYQIRQQGVELRGRELGRKEGRMEGIFIGEERGRAEGVRQEKVNAANKMLSRKMPIDVISDLTGLSISEINKLKAALNTN